MTKIDIGGDARIYTRDEWDARLWRTFTHQPDSLLTQVFIHHTVTEHAHLLDHFDEQIAVAQSIQNFHMDSPLRRYSDIGYSFLVYQQFGNIDVTRIFQGRPVNHVTAAQTPNTGKVAISVVGDFSAGEDAVRDKTVTAIVELIKHVKENNGDRLTRLGGHQDINETSCPGSALMSKLNEIANRTGLRRL